MRYDSLDTFLSDGKEALIKGPVAMVFAEDLVEVDTTLRHHITLGFKAVLLFAPDELTLPEGLELQIHRIRYATRAPNMLTQAVNRLIAAAPGIWMYYCYNAEYLFFPFCETRSITDMLTFHTEERRGGMLTYVVDLYAGDLHDAPNAVSLEDACLDKSGYYALGRMDTAGHPKERQLDFFGGLRWRFEEHIPANRRHIDRIAIFKAKKGLTLSETHLFSEEEYNTYACPWHHNLTATIVSFRTAKALKTNSGSTYDIDSFRWHNSTEFEWHSQQLLDLGLMEPGQWF
ncbi:MULTISPECIES: hypothetical protein [Roseobacteraceae]|uniref:hypothetical protein n=1 Tax=Roseobacteraceae TaxID=2854170 RepID=UPI00125F1E73|nr:MULTISPECIES: hypothetical protein [Roseobacteraceae]KAB6717052.1 hypothetical protein C8029_06690 [Roseobacter sp. TSBP12]|tara:strand:+ start:3055 stop:3918 length:864 start_codon:yes stop_codon:yes gene_type:complete